MKFRVLLKTAGGTQHGELTSRTLKSAQAYADRVMPDGTLRLTVPRWNTAHTRVNGCWRAGDHISNRS